MNLIQQVFSLLNNLLLLWRQYAELLKWVYHYLWDFFFIESLRNYTTTLKVIIIPCTSNQQIWCSLMFGISNFSRNIQNFSFASSIQQYPMILDQFFILLTWVVMIPFNFNSVINLFLNNVLIFLSFKLKCHFIL